MSDKDKVKALIRNLERKGNNWKMVLGTETFTAGQMIQRLKDDPQFRDMILDQLDLLSIALTTK